MGSWLKFIVRRKVRDRQKTASSDKVSDKDDPKPWTVWKCSSGCEEGLAQEGSQDLEVTASKEEEHKEESKREEQAAILIQTAFRRFLARRTLRALKALACLRASINGRAVRKQSLASIRAIRDFVRIQAQIHGQRAMKRRDLCGGPMKPLETAPSPSTVESEAEWCDANGTLEEIHARAQQRQEAAAKRERALAYAFSNQWRANSTFNSEYCLDYELDNSTWSWIWLDRWISGANNVSKEKSEQGSKVKRTREYTPRKDAALKQPVPVVVMKRASSKVGKSKSNDKLTGRDPSLVPSGITSD